MQGLIQDSTQQMYDDKKVLVEKLVDKKNPEMVTYVVPIEIDDIAILQTLGQDLDKQRSKMSLEESFLTKFVRNNLVLRTSIKGTRSQQIVNTVNNVAQDFMLNRGQMSSQGKSVLGL